MGGELMGVGAWQNLAAVIIGLILAVATLLVPFFFFLGWLSLKPQVGHGNLAGKSRSKQPRRLWAKAAFSADGQFLEGEAKYGKIKPGPVRVLPALAADLGPGSPVNAYFVSLDNCLCAFDDGRRIFYRHRDMLKIALEARVGRTYWLPILALPCLLAVSLLPGLSSILGLTVDYRAWLFSFFPGDPLLTIGIVFGAYLLLSIVFWHSLVRLRANALIRRVERCLAWIDLAYRRPAPPVEYNPVPGTGRAALLCLLSLGLGLFLGLQYVAPALGWSLW